MAEISTDATFRRTRRGYDPHHVEARVNELTAQLSAAGAVAELQRRRADDSEPVAESLRAQLRELEVRTSVPDFDVVAGHVLSIQQAAEEAATELRTRIAVEAANHNRKTEECVAQSLLDARADADAIAERARRVADDLIAASDGRVAQLAADIARLEQQRDALISALGGLHEQLTRAAQDLVTSDRP